VVLQSGFAICTNAPLVLLVGAPERLPNTLDK